MSVATLSRYKTERDYIETVMKHSHAIRDAVVELGAERLVIGQALAGQYTGDWVTMIRAKDMATLDKILRALPDNKDFQAIMGSGKMTLEGRHVLDIPEGF